jgi:Leu/Phe-tRNA-protein transferase
MLILAGSCLGGDLSSERLQLAYQSGIFPWFEDGEPITWWSPNPRMVLFQRSWSLLKACETSLIEIYLQSLSKF